MVYYGELNPFHLRFKMERAHRYIYRDITKCIRTIMKLNHVQIIGKFLDFYFSNIYIYSASSLDSHIGFIQNPKLLDYK